ncbi:hypothetical protein IAQ61_011552 [Plenodomus lingam]|uniref:uncharacterized protein n=1 Tax=Leptosphaeria maculans TaxID=5022 RepID=UPI003327C1E7|nr:hypothetical protein IAQ61_011552 [Plenodomus lingam]
MKGHSASEKESQAEHRTSQSESAAFGTESASDKFLARPNHLQPLSPPVPPTPLFAFLHANKQGQIQATPPLLLHC